MFSNLKAMVQRTYCHHRQPYLITIIENGVGDADLVQFRGVIDDFGFICLVRRVG